MSVAHFVLIPFLLGVQVPDESQWKYGPEYTFDFNTTLVFNTDEQREAALSQKNIKIICKPANPNALQCRANDSALPFSLFEIHVYYLIGDEPKNPWRVAKQLQKVQNSQKFKTVNKQCTDRYTVSREELNDKTLSAPFRLTWYPNDTMESMVTKVNREMEDVDSCDINVDYLYPGRAVLVQFIKKIDMDLYFIKFQRNSTYGITITPENFVISMKNTIIRDKAYHKNQSLTDITIEQMSFSLSSVGPAKSAEIVPELKTEGFVSVHVPPSFEF